MLSKRFVGLVLLVFALTIGAVNGDLIHHWTFDVDGTDSVGGLDGVVPGPVAVPAKVDNGLQFDGQDDSVEFSGFVAPTQGTFVLWLNAAEVQARGRFLGAVDQYEVYVENGLIANQLFSAGSLPNYVVSSTTLLPDTWYHLALTYDGTSNLQQIYINGELDAEGMTADDTWNGGNFAFGHRAGQNQQFYNGILDDVRLYDHVLSQEEIKALMTGEVSPKAWSPSPEDGSTIEATWTTLSWKPGPFAASHDVYLGENFDDVDNGAGDTFKGNLTQETLLIGFTGLPYPDGLVPGTTYYWRIDEVNETEPNSPWIGNIWSFSVPPKIAYNPIPADGDGIADTTVTLNWTPGLNARLHTIYFGDDYDEVDNATEGVNRATADYSPGQLEGEKVYYWRVDEFDGIETVKGDVWAFTTPGAVGNPQPANWADDVVMTTVLSWTAADNAVSHELYFGMDKDAVRNADTTSPEYVGPKALAAVSHDVGLLEPNTTYYWRVDEVYSGNTVKGPVWTFTVGAYLLIDDFESYTDDDAANEAIWQTWVDGYNDATNGAQVGYMLPPYAEPNIVHGGNQSMPLVYTNEAGVTNSEVSLMLTTPRDWTVAGANELSLWIRGDSANSLDPLYVSISNPAGAAAVVAYDNPQIAQSGAWIQWIIPLQAFADQGIDLTNVDKLSIGLGTKSGMTAVGGTGTMYIDDIRLLVSSN